MEENWLKEEPRYEDSGEHAEAGFSSFVEGESRRPLLTRKYHLSIKAMLDFSAPYDHLTADELCPLARYHHSAGLSVVVISPGTP